MIALVFCSPALSLAFFSICPSLYVRLDPRTAMAGRLFTFIDIHFPMHGCRRVVLIFSFCRLPEELPALQFLLLMSLPVRLLSFSLSNFDTDLLYLGESSAT